MERWKFYHEAAKIKRNIQTQIRDSYAIRILSGVLIVALAGTGISVSSVSAAKAKGEHKQTHVQVVSDDTDGQSGTQDALEDILSDSVTITETEIGKEETVYIIADDKGAAKNMIVSDHLLNHEGKETITDASSLKDIENVKGEETFTQDGQTLTWNAGGNDIYYQGTSEKKPPITQNITYYLDGKEIAPKELAGKSGKVKIRFDYTNHEKSGDVYVPFMAISGMVLDDSFRNVQVTNGKVIADGNRQVVVGYTLPGLKESLQVSDGDFDAGITLPEYFEVTADVTDFTLDMTMTVVMNAANFIHAEGGSSLSLEDELNSLTDATGRLEDGSAALADGVDTLKSKLGEFQNGMNTLADGVIEDELNSLTDATGRLEDGSAALADGVDTLKSKLGEFQNGMNTLADGVSSLQNGAGSLADGANALNTSAQAINNGIAALDTTLRTALTEEEKAAYVAQAQASVDATFAPNALNTSAQAINNGIAALDTTLRTALTEEEKAAYVAQAQASVDATFAPGTDTYNMIFNSAKQSFADAMNQSTGMIAQSLAADASGNPTALYQALFAASSEQAFMQYAQGQGLDLTQMSVADYQAALAQFRGANQAAIHEQVMAGLETIASGVTGGIAAQGADTTAAGVVSACQSASKQAAAGALVTGIETTKNKIADSIEATQANGYSLVTGAAALSAGTQALAAKVPELVNGVNALKDGAGKLQSGTGAIVDGVGTLGEGAHEHRQTVTVL